MLQSRPPRQVNRCPQASPYLCRNMWPRDATPSLSSDPSFVFRRLASWRNKIKYWVHSRSLITASFQFSLDLIRLPSTKLFFPFELFAEYVELRCTLCRYVFFDFLMFVFNFWSLVIHVASNLRLRCGVLADDVSGSLSKYPARSTVNIWWRCVMMMYVICEIANWLLNKIVDL